MILADDLGCADVGHDLSKIETPSLDRLESQGMKLTQFYASAPVCSPTRAALLTGRYPHSVGMPAIASPNVRGNVPILSLSHDAMTIPQALKSAGYILVLAGKWHLDHPKGNWPGHIPAGAVRDEPAIVMDLMPTFLEAAGVTPPEGCEMHGRSIMPLLKGAPYSIPESLHWETENNYAVLKGQWKLVRQFWFDRPFLYDVKNDLGEHEDLAEKYPEKVAELETLHEEWVKKCYPKPLPRVTKRATGRFPKE